MAEKGPGGCRWGGVGTAQAWLLQRGTDALAPVLASTQQALGKSSMGPRCTLSPDDFQASWPQDPPALKSPPELLLPWVPRVCPQHRTPAPLLQVFQLEASQCPRPHSQEEGTAHKHT